MAKFEVHELEGCRHVDITLEDETVRAEAGALCCMTGNVTLNSRLIPSIGGLIKSLLAEESVYRPTYAGTRVVSRVGAASCGSTGWTPPGAAA